MPDTLKLVVRAGEKKGKEFPLLASPLRIGRLPDNDIVFGDKMVSRHHSEIFFHEGRHKIRDLESQNGTWVNGVRIETLDLKPGDAVEIGNNTLLVVSAAAEIFPEEDSPGLKTTIIPAKEILKNAAEENTGNAPLDIVRRRTLMLSAIYQLSRDMLQHWELEAILNLTADTILGNIRAERVFILIRDRETGGIKPVLSRDVRASSSAGTGRLMLSRTVVDRVMEEEISVLVADARKDARFNGAESIFLYGIRSAMCVPLLGAESVIGNIYVDILNSDRQFTQDELHLLTTIGNLAAIVIEQAALREKIQKESEARQRLMRYHSPHVVEEIIKGRGNLAVNERMVTVLFTDIKDFTLLSERVGPMESARLLNEYFDIITDMIFAHSGSIDKFIGDAAMAIFGAPFHTGDYAEMAVKAAVGIQREIKKLDKYELRVGINTGPAFIGNIGSTKRLEYTAIGDTVNIAARLEKMARPGGIYMGEETYRLVKDIFRTRAIGMQKVRGKTMEVGIYEVLYE